MSNDPAHAPAPEEDPEIAHSGEARLLTVSEAASLTGLSRKAIERRVDRGTLRSVHDERGWRMIPRAELARADLLDEGTPGGGDTGREVVIWREMFEREQAAHEATREELGTRAEEERRRGDEAAARAEQLHADLAAIANAGPLRAWALRREQRRQLHDRP